MGCTSSRRRAETLSALLVEGRNTLRLTRRYDTIVHEKQLRDTLFALHGMAFIRLRLASGCWAWYVQMKYNDNHSVLASEYSAPNLFHGNFFVAVPQWRQLSDAGPTRACPRQLILTISTLECGIAQRV